MKELETKHTPARASGIHDYHAVEISMESAKKSLRSLDAADTPGARRRGSEFGQEDKRIKAAVQSYIQQTLLAKGSQLPKQRPGNPRPQKGQKGAGESKEGHMKALKAKTKCRKCGKKGH